MYSQSSINDVIALDLFDEPEKTFSSTFETLHLYFLFLALIVLIVWGYGEVYASML